MGDRVAVYKVATRYGEMDEARSLGTVLALNNHHCLCISVDDEPAQPHYYHPKQCRRLKPKTPRRRLWVNERQPCTSIDGISYSAYPSQDLALHYKASIPRGVEVATIEFVEVRKKK